ncbi:VOC family protein [Pseudogracilibacillus auburnensis]|uniref:Putative enzyme related to lactoylglutathione lyase n=1 Tax=Pseudogracilibacillus auburnensis TaxID=1494959 RepID=A0A2V3WBX0_9BACI|nr:VOC family protein [Pseudogracilibacillus auburnensis]PXW90531.1 putative enzyme related to lactoylglutathione lyase [Pseudogracilibacillus auburnensis]
MYKPGFTLWYSVSDVERTLEFYTEKLGFEMDSYDKENGMGSVHTNTKECYIGFSEAEQVVPSTAAAVFEVEDIDAAVKKLTEKGIVFNGEVSTIPEYVKLISFKDPDGHHMELSQTL